MKQMLKRILCLLTIVALMLPTVALAADYETHWVAETAQKLIEKGIVSGDESGNLNPDANILRSEYVKIINRAFSLTAASGENFPDVAADAWYAKDMLIAKTAGYLTGDEDGMANPEAAITRVEAVVILVRVMKLSANEYGLSFTDATEIPAWAEKEIATLVKEGIISGYPDGSFRPNNPISRAEAFSLIEKSMPLPATDSTVAEQNPHGNVAGTTSIIPSVGGSISSGSGGGGSVVVKKPATPVITSFDVDTGILKWQEAKNAESYVVTVALVGDEDNGIETETDELSVDLSEEIAEICNDSSVATFELAISLYSVKGKYESAVNTITETKTYACLPTPTLSVKTGSIGDTGIAAVFWDAIEGANGYQPEFYIDGILSNTSIIYNEGDCKLRIPDVSVFSGKEASISVKALSSDSELRDSNPATIDIVYVAAGETAGSGIQADPYRISTAEGFMKIAENPSAYYVLEKDIDLGSIDPITTEFKGTIDGQNHRLTYQIAYEGPCGLFMKLNGATIQNLVLCGNVHNTLGGYGTDKDNTGALAKEAVSATKLINCINFCEVKGGRYTGGFAGAFGGTMQNCINVGNVTGDYARDGGLVGNLTGNSLMENCANIGNVTSQYQVGGLTGHITAATIKDSYNTGAITSTRSIAAGISPFVANVVNVTNCFNLGSITTPDHAVGLIGNSSSVSMTLTMSNSYNAGSLAGTLGSHPHTTSIGEASNINASYYNTTNFLYTGAVYTPDTADKASAENLVNVTEVELKDETNEKVIAFMEAANGAYVFQNDGTDYPSLASNPVLTKEAAQKYTTKLNLAASYNAGALEIAWDAVDTSVLGDATLTLTVENKNFFETIAEDTPAITDTTYSLADVDTTCYHQVTLTLTFANGFTVTETVEVPGISTIAKIFLPEENIGVTLETALPQNCITDIVDGVNYLYTTSTAGTAVLNVVNLDTKTVEGSYLLTGAGKVWRHAKDSKGRIYMVSGRLHRYDPATKTVTDFGVFDAGEGAAFTLCVDEQDNVYIGTSANAKIIKFDAKTETFENWGTVLEGMTYVRTIAYHKGYLYCGVFSTVPGKMVRVDVSNPANKTVFEAPETDDYDVSKIRFFYESNMADDLLICYIQAPDAYRMLVFDTVKGEWVENSYNGAYKGLFTTPALEGKAYFSFGGEWKALDTATGTAENIGWETASYPLYGGGWVELKGYPDFPGKTFVTLDLSEEDVGNILFINFETKKLMIWDDLALKGNPLNYGLIGDMPDGGIFVSASGAPKNHWFHPQTGDSDNFIGGQIEGSVAYNGKLYLGAYTGARILEYDPTRPAEANVNPRQVAALTNQDRPFAMTAGDGKIFGGTIAKYGDLPGSLFIYDIETGAFYEENNVVENQGIMGIAYKDGILYGSTTIHGGLGSTPSEREAKIFVYDVAKRQKIKEFVPQIPGLDDPVPTHIGDLEFGPDGRLWCATGYTLFSLDPQTEEVSDVFTFGNFTRYSYESHWWKPHYIEFDDLGNIYVNMNGLRVLNPDSGETKRLTNYSVSNYTIGGDGNLYMAVGTEIRRIPIQDQ